MSAAAKPRLSQILNLTVLVAALGYFVDMFGLLPGPGPEGGSVACGPSSKLRSFPGYRERSGTESERV